HEALLRALLQILEHALVPWVIGNHQKEVVGRFENLAFLFNRQEAAIIAQGMDDDRGVLPRLDDFIQIDNCAMLHAERQRPIDPHRLLAFEQIPPHEIGGGKIFMAGHRDQGTTKPVGHMLDESGLAAPGWSLQHHRHLAVRRNREQADLATDLRIERLLCDSIVPDIEFTSLLCHLTLIRSAVSFASRLVRGTINGTEAEDQAIWLEQPGAAEQAPEKQCRFIKSSSVRTCETPGQCSRRMLKKASLLTRPTPARRDAPCPKQGRRRV